MLETGAEIKEYTLKKFLGRGGFGEVWLAEKKIEIADKKVPFALKFLSGESQSLANFSSVRQEINTWIEASGNRHVISVLDGFIYENYFVIVSEYADGGSLRQWLRARGGKSPSLEKTVELMGGILEGLSHLHAQKIVHRDLKPENILLKGDVPCITDFGVSKMVETVNLTNPQTGTATAGSPLYMSPESFERIKPSPQVDVWSAGVILFEMLSGKTPYAADTVPALIFEIVTKEPRALPADIPTEIQNVVKKALHKDVSQRFQSAREMRDALMKALYLQDYVPTVRDAELAKNSKQGEPYISDQTVPISEIKEEPKKKTGLWLGIGAGAALAVAVGVFGLTQFSNQANSSNISVSSPAQAVETEKTDANSENVKTAETSAAPQQQTAEKPAEAPAATKPKSVSPAAPKKTEAAQAKPKPTGGAKKKVTLDDLIK